MRTLEFYTRDIEPLYPRPLPQSMGRLSRFGLVLALHGVMAWMLLHGQHLHTGGQTSRHTGSLWVFLDAKSHLAALARQRPAAKEAETIHTSASAKPATVDAAPPLQRELAKIDQPDHKRIRLPAVEPARIVDVVAHNIRPASTPGSQAGSHNNASPVTPGTKDVRAEVAAADNGVQDDTHVIRILNLGVTRGSYALPTISGEQIFKVELGSFSNIELAIVNHVIAQLRKRYPDEITWELNSGGYLQLSMHKEDQARLEKILQLEIFGHKATPSRS